MDRYLSNESSGWIKLYRKLLENPLIKEPRLLQVMAYCLLKANYKETKMLWNGQEIILKPGQFITGRTQANNDLGLKSVMFDRKLKVLQNRGFLNREVNNRFSIITITNWEEYQGRQEEVNSQMNNKRTTDEQQMNTNKNVKNVKNEKEVKTFPVGKTKDTELESDGLPKHKPRVDRTFLKKIHEDALRLKKEIREKNRKFQKSERA